MKGLVAVSPVTPAGLRVVTLRVLLHLPSSCWILSNKQKEVKAYFRAFCKYVTDETLQCY